LSATQVALEDAELDHVVTEIAQVLDVLLCLVRNVRAAECELRHFDVVFFSGKLSEAVFHRGDLRSFLPKLLKPDVSHSSHVAVARVLPPPHGLSLKLRCTFFSHQCRVAMLQPARAGYSATSVCVAGDRRIIVGKFCIACVIAVAAEHGVYSGALPPAYRHRDSSAPRLQLACAGKSANLTRVFEALERELEAELKVSYMSKVLYKNNNAEEM
jgi:hypothetical protein